MKQQKKDNSKRSWNKYEAEQYYIESKDLISLRDLASIAGRGTTTVFKWSKAGNWVSKREKYWAELNKKTREKTISRVSDVWSKEAEELATEHLEHHKKFRKLAEMLLDTAISIASNSEDPIEVFRKLKTGDLNHISQISERAVKGERDSVGLHLAIDPNAAIRLIESMGYVIIDPSEPVDSRVIGADLN
ncbi:MAG: hypothetical protein QNJ54_18530 [Prochloraceae cyanobacterium]|nr:hypothetical protein [Prochloraceae cyanobacterium]